jgi:DNA polymerase
MLYLDLETYNERPITDGTYAYAESAEVMLLAWVIDDGPVGVVDLASGDVLPHALTAAIDDVHQTVCAHNSMFDRTVLREALGIDIPLERWVDTMVQAHAHSLPGSLGDLCDIMRVPVDKAKVKDARELLLLFCKPRPKNSKIHRATRKTHPEQWARFVEYARLDVESMRVLWKKLPRWNYPGNAFELDLWRLDQRVNDRGMAIDLPMVNAAIDAIQAAQRDFTRQTQEDTLGLVESTTKRDQTLRFLLAAYGVDLPDLTAATVQRRLQDENLPPELRALLAVRLEASTTSTAKYATIRKSVSRDGRLRGTLQFCGASRTGRWAGRMVQPQNLPRPEYTPEEIDVGIEALKAGALGALFPVMRLTSSAVRGAIVGDAIVAADLANIEGRMLAWLAREQWKLDAFAAYDRGEGPDTYVQAYARAFGVDLESVDKARRQVGKVMELALGYEGGVGAFCTFAEVYNIDLARMADAAVTSIPQSVVDEARRALVWTKEQKRPRYGLDDRVWLVCDSLKRMWRAAHPEVVQFWRDLEAAAIMAVERADGQYAARRVMFDRIGPWLRMRLPSGRYLCYPSPAIVDGKLTYMGLNQYTRKWTRLSTYGGKLAENATQAAARDVLTHAMPAIEREYDIILTVHDEVVTEGHDAERLAELMSVVPPWAPGLPLAAKGFEAQRYGKPD